MFATIPRNLYIPAHICTYSSNLYIPPRLFCAIYIFHHIFPAILCNLCFLPRICAYSTQFIYSTTYLQLFCAIYIFHHIFATTLCNLYIPPHICGYSAQSVYSTTYLRLFYAIYIFHHIVEFDGLHSKSLNLTVGPPNH